MEKDEILREMWANTYSERQPYEFNMMLKALNKTRADERAKVIQEEKEKWGLEPRKIAERERTRIVEMLEKYIGECIHNSPDFTVQDEFTIKDIIQKIKAMES